MSVHAISVTLIPHFDLTFSVSIRYRTGKNSSAVEATTTKIEITAIQTEPKKKKPTSDARPAIRIT